MALSLPEIGLLRALEALINWVKSNHEACVLAGTENSSYLYRAFGGVVYGGFNYYDQAKAIFLADALDQRKLAVRVFFDMKRASLPTIHITLPGENQDLNGLGYNDDGETSLIQSKVRFSLVVTSDNYSEVLIIYYMVRSLMIAGQMTLESFGIRNVTLSGGDLTLQSDIVPNNVFYRAIFVDMFYEEDIPSIEFDPEDIINAIYLNSTLVEKFEPEIVYSDIVWVTYEW